LQNTTWATSSLRKGEKKVGKRKRAREKKKEKEKNHTSFFYAEGKA
jgi:hypothetical protein